MMMYFSLLFFVFMCRTLGPVGCPWRRWKLEMGYQRVRCSRQGGRNRESMREAQWELSTVNIDGDVDDGSSRPQGASRLSLKLQTPANDKRNSTHIVIWMTQVIVDICFDQVRAAFRATSSLVNLLPSRQSSASW
ncbi:hypothetical protein QBC36DRAFT_322906 [Triangularia setosa]|uniref:Secreted protein n=1 Tax=Triangularia setosa TaxID=2587417 RepID=A0AAN6WC37_9PEZI|nr:hypothetical protein QBC36DRAFT_322906 [Podospora setosa]